MPDEFVDYYDPDNSVINPPDPNGQTEASHINVAGQNLEVAVNTLEYSSSDGGPVITGVASDGSYVTLLPEP